MKTLNDEIPNARLVAAAPEMLEALRSILVQDTGDLSDAAFRRYVCSVLVEKTLAKVEGGAK